MIAARGLSLVGYRGVNERASRWLVATCGAAGCLPCFTGTLSAQHQVDLSQAAVETVVEPCFEGECFHRIGDIVVNDDGIWVLDSGQGKIWRFGHDGRTQTQYGRPGNGPDEFLNPTRLNVDTMLDVLDPRQGRIIRFALAGDHIATRTTPKVANTLRVRVPPLLVSPMSDGTTVAVTSGWYASEPAYSDPYERVLVVRPGTDQRADTVFSYHFGGARWRVGRHFGGLNVPFGSAGAVDVLGDTALVVADGVAGVVSLLRIAQDTVIVADTVDIRLRGVPTTIEDVDDVRLALRESHGTLPRDVVIDMPEYWSVASAVVTLPDGTVWVRQAASGPRQRWTVASFRSPNVWRIVLPERFDLLAVHGRQVYGVARDALDVERVGRVEVEPFP